MGIDYSFVIVLPQDRVALLLRNVAAASRPDPKGSTTVTVGEEHIDIPGSSGFRYGETLVLGESPLTHESFGLDLSLRLADDDLVDAYLADSPGTNGYIGLIYVYASAADWYQPGYLAVRFMAATSRMSRLFENSGAVRGWFAELAVRSGAAICLLDVETEQDWLVMAHGRTLLEQLPWSHNYLRCRCLAGGAPLPGL